MILSVLYIGKAKGCGSHFMRAVHTENGSNAHWIVFGFGSILMRIGIITLRPHAAAENRANCHVS